MMLERVVIVGGGTAGWMTAAALSKVCQGTHISITLVESNEIGTIGVGEASIPSLRDFNAFLGLDERAFFKITNATVKLGIRFDGWLSEGSSYLHPFGEFGTEENYLPFQQWWLRAKRQWPDISKFSLETQAAEAGKFAHLTGIDHELLGRTAYAYHLDAALYARALRQMSEAQGVQQVEGRIEHIEITTCADGSPQIRALKLADGLEIAGDFFVDCSGFRSMLLGDAMNVEFRSWKSMLPCDRAWAIQCERKIPKSPFTRSRATTAGWTWRIPLQNRVGNGHVFSSAHLTNDAALDQLLDSLEGDPTTDPRLIRFEAGHRAAFWRGNCVAIGLSSGFLEPLESTSIHLIQFGIMRLLGYFPVAQNSPSQAAAYNHDMTRKFIAIRDFLVLHYWANERDEDLWRYCRTMEIPESLKQRVSLYRDSGTLVVSDEELFRPASWIAVLEGQGKSAVRGLPLAGGLPEQDVHHRLSQLDQLIRSAVAGMPSADEYVSALAEAGQSILLRQPYAQLFSNAVGQAH